jgi:hypothetical protein
MVSYGPWVQDPDYMPVWTITTNDPDSYVNEIVQTGAETPYQNPAYQISVDDITDAFDGAQSALAHKGGWVESLASAYNLVFPNWKSGWTARVWARTFPFTNREHMYHPLNQGVIPPASAVGLAFENHPYNPEDPWGFITWDVAQNLALRLRSTTELEGQFEDGRVLGGEPLPWSSSSNLMLSVAGAAAAEEVGSFSGPSFSTSPNWYIRTLGVSIDLTVHGALEPGWSANLYTHTPAARVGGDPGFPESTVTSFGWLLNDLRFEADVRPPRYRWVYDSAPYRRTFPRDDGLAGGAGRTYPPSRAIQTSNRTSGYL